MKRQVQYPTFRFGGFEYGQCSYEDRLIPPGYAKTLRNMRFIEDGIRNRNGWDTITNGLTASNTWTWDDTTKDTGFFREFARSDSGKIAAFEKRIFYDTDGTSEDFVGGGNTAIAAGQTIKGTFWFAGTFYVYTAEKIYSVNTSTGAMTEEIDFSSDLDSNYDNVIQMLQRFGEMWAVSGKNSRLFFSDTGVIERDVAGAVTNEPFDIAINEWVRLENNIIVSSSETVEIKKQQGVQLSQDILPNTSYAYFNADPTWAFSDGDDVFLVRGEELESNTFDSAAALTADLHLNASSSISYVIVKANENGDFAGEQFTVGETVTVSDDSSSESKTIINTVKGDYLLTPVVTLFFDSNLANDYTTAANAKVTSSTKYKGNFDETWEKGYKLNDSGGTLGMIEYVWSSLVNGTHYEMTYDPDNTDTIQGHVKLLDVAPVSFALEARISYTADANPWLEGNSGYIDVASDLGEIVEVVDTRAGLYIFKKNPGAIYLLKGEPGPNGTPGTLELVPIYTKGVTAEPGSIQPTRSGVYFSSIDVDDVRTYFLPLTIEELTEIPEVSERHKPPFGYIGNSSYSITFKSAIVHGDMYLLSALATSGTDSPEAHLTSYLCQAFYDGSKWRGRWAEWDDCQNEEYGTDNPTYSVIATPRTVGYYEHQGELFRVYILRDASDADEKDYYIARYSQNDGNETALDKVNMLVDKGAGNVIDTYDDGFWLDIKSAKLSIPGVDLFTVKKIWYHLNCTAGDMDADFFKDYSTTSVVTKSVTGLTDASGSEQFLRWHKLNFNCQYLQVRLRFKDVDSASEEHLHVKDIEIAYSPKTSRGVITQANV